MNASGREDTGGPVATELKVRLSDRACLRDRFDKTARTLCSLNKLRQ
jgi:hypothetical protein